MLLQRLVEYADREADELPADYYRTKVIHGVLNITEGGRAAQVDDERLPPKRRDEAIVEQVPYVQRSGTKVPPYLLVDTAEFALGVPKAEKNGAITDKARVEAERRHAAYRELALRWVEMAKDDPAAETLRVFLSDDGPRDIPGADAMDAKDTIALKIGDRWLHTIPSVQQLWGEVVRERKGGSDRRTALCLVCGETRELLETIPEPVKKGAIPTAGGSNEGQLISINAPAQGRRGVTQLTNTPICHHCGGRAMAVLNHLLNAKKHSRRFRDDGALLWWTRYGTDDEALSALFEDDPDPGAVSHLIDTLNTKPTPHAASAVDADNFHSVSLGLNNARLVVREWLDVPVPTVKRALGAWYKDHGVYDGWQDKTLYFPLWRLAQSCGRWTGERYAKDSTPRDVEAELFHSALRGAPLPHRLMPLVLQRIHADRRIDGPRVALLRLLLNRSADSKDHVTMKLDENCTDPPYVAGRIFAVLEAIQRRALPDLNTTLRDKHFPAAATAPRAVFSHLRTNANAHLKRLRRDNEGAAGGLDNRLAELSKKLDQDLPAHMNPTQHSRFIIGYDHERAESLAKASAASKAKQQAEQNADQAKEDGSSDA